MTNSIDNIQRIKRLHLTCDFNDRHFLNGHEYVDLGLPSSTMWGKCNVGAKEESNDGLYFSWGNIDGHDKGSLIGFGESSYNVSFDFGEASYNASFAANMPFIQDISNSDYDMVKGNLGTPWVLPTQKDFRELIYNCLVKTDEINGVQGKMFTSRINGKKVFFPFSGYCYRDKLYCHRYNAYYWSSTRVDNFHNFPSAMAMAITQNTIPYIKFKYEFYNGFSIRGVLKKE